MDIPRIAGANDEPARPVVLAASVMTPGAALDLACGAGRHAKWLAAQGWKVTAVDRNADLVRELKRKVPAIEVRVADLETGGYLVAPGAWDLIVCWLYMHRELYPAIRAGARPGGVAALCALLVGRYAAQRGELRSYFPGWTVLHDAEGERTSELVVQRPGV